MYGKKTDQEHRRISGSIVLCLYKRVYIGPDLLVISEDVPKENELNEELCTPSETFLNTPLSSDILACSYLIVQRSVAIS